MKRANWGSGTLIAAGIIVIMIGVCFCLVKGGIPYQDPTEEMMIRWLASWYAGETCLLWGAATAVLGVAGKLVCKMLAHRA